MIRETISHAYIRQAEIAAIDVMQGCLDPDIHQIAVNGLFQFCPEKPVQMAA